MNTIAIQSYRSALGVLTIGAYGDSLCLLEFEQSRAEQKVKRERVVQRVKKAFNAEIVECSTALTRQAITELSQYFSGERQRFDLPLHLIGTSFQKRVWSALLEIPYGETRSYLELARELKHAEAVRAVANANGANALSIFIPCHRIISHDGTLGGYGGGVGTKRFLLNLEKENSASQSLNLLP